MTTLNREQKKRLERMKKAVAESGSDRLKAIPLEELAKMKSIPLTVQIKAIMRAKRIQKITKAFKLFIALFVLFIVLRWVVFLIFHK